MISVYVSGPMTGLPELNFPAFHAAAAMLRAHGYQVVNPAEINPGNSKTWLECMRADIKALADCDAVATLPEWTKSRGATLEVHIAERLGLPVAPVEVFVASAAAAMHRPAASRGQVEAAVCAMPNGKAA